MVKQRSRLVEIHSVSDVDPGTGLAAQLWRTLHVEYAVRRGRKMLQRPGSSPKIYALPDGRRTWMRTLVGLREGGHRRIDASFPSPWGRCTIDARLLAVSPFVPPLPGDLVVGAGDPVGEGDQVRVRYELSLRQDRVVVDRADEATFTIGAGEVFAGLEHAVAGMRPGGIRWGDLAPPNAYGQRLRGLPSNDWLSLWIELLD